MSSATIVVYGSILLVGGAVLTKDFYSGVKQANAADIGNATLRDKEFFRDDPAAHYEQFCKRFVQRLKDLPDVKQRESRHNQFTLVMMDNGLSSR